MTENAFDLTKARFDLISFESCRKKRALTKFGLAALGAIPWVGGFLSAAATFKSEERDAKANQLQSQWLKEHEEKLVDLVAALNVIAARLDSLGDEIDERIESDDYLELVRKSFRAWDRADTDEKRKIIGNLITNSAGVKLCSDDVVRLFIDWINLYHESHFAVIRAIYQSPGITRGGIWEQLRGDFPREDSADADLYKLLIRDLSTGGVIRQARDTDSTGRFIRRPPVKRRGNAPSTLESAFEDIKPYVLTALGEQFVHYTMNEVVQRVENKGVNDGY